MSAIVTYRGTVYPWHCDHIGHMNVMWYVGKFDEATWHFFNSVGITPTYLRESRFGMAAVKQVIAYRREVMAGDVVEIRTRLLEVRDKVVRFVHEMRNAERNEVVAETELTCVHLDREAHKACPLPEAIRARAVAAVVSGPDVDVG